MKVEVFDPQNAVLASTIVKANGNANGKAGAYLSGTTRVSLSFYSMIKGNYRVRFTPVADAKGTGGAWVEALVGNVALYFKGNPLALNAVGQVPAGWKIVDAGEQKAAGAAGIGPRIFKFAGGDFSTGLYIRQSDASKAGYAEFGSTWFADEFTAREATGATGMMFNVINLVWCIFMVFGICGLLTAPKGTSGKSKLINLALIVIPAAILGYTYMNSGDSTVAIDAPIFQQFNPCFVVALTPVSIALFGWLGRIGKEPKAPVKIGLGMLVAAGAYLLMTVSSLGLPATDHPNHVADVTPNLLVGTYLILTFAELLLSPIGISFVSKVAPPKYKGMIMGGWFVATALGNKLVSIPGHMWDMPLPVVWGTLMVICLLAALFIFSIIKKLNRVS